MLYSIVSNRITLSCFVAFNIIFIQSIYSVNSPVKMVFVNSVRMKQFKAVCSNRISVFGFLLKENGDTIKTDGREREKKIDTFTKKK